MKPARMALGSAMSASVVVAVVAAMTAGCPQTGHVAYCDLPDYKNYASDGRLDECHCEDDAGTVGIRSEGYCAHWWSVRDAGEAGAEGPPASCSGLCLPLPPLGWSDPALLWIGAEIDAPDCPDVAPVIGYEGHADLDAPNTCGACSCEPPAGSCGLPETITANAATCANTNAITPRTPWDPPVPWDGTCTADDAVPANKLCMGVKCVQSVTIGPLTLTEDACAPASQPVPLKATAVWGTYGRACIGSTTGGCEDHGTTCAAVPEVASGGFLTCIFHEGDVECPEGSSYADKHVLYGGLDDTRACSPCGCGAPVGSKCEALVSVYADGACGAELGAVTVTTEAPEPPCLPVPAGSPLGSKSAGPATYTPGACQASGGEPMGAAEPSGAATFCCSAG